MKIERSKTAVVTGANSGIGFETASGLLEAGYRVLCVCRDEERGAAAVKALGDGAELILADLSAQAQVRAAARDIEAACDAVDVLVNNAAVWLDARQTTVDGIETTLAVNHLAPFILTLELLDHLAPGARVVNVASEAHRRATLRLDDLQGERTYGRMQTYGQSKLCNVLFSNALAARLKAAGKEVTSNALHPGVIATNLGKGTSFFGLFIKLGRLFLKDPEEGAQTTLWAATAPELEGVSGRYLKDSAIAEPSKAAQSVADAEALWEASEALTGVNNIL